MISIIVCSVNPGYLEALKKNVAEFIGTEHEWLIWDNRVLNTGLCEVYNKMAVQSKYTYLCFLHEDILIDTVNWGNLLIKISEEQSISLLGVAGGKYKSNMLSGWYSGGEKLDYFSVIHKNEDKEEIISIPEIWENCEEEVATIDGVFMFCTKSAWKTTRFNDKLLKGFHYYDIDFSLRVAQNYRVMVTNRLRLIHKTTGGDFGDNWVNQTILYHAASTAILPFSVKKDIEKQIDIKVAKYWLDWLKNMEICWSNRWKWIRIQQLYNYPSLFYQILKFLLYKPLKLKSIHRLFLSK